MVRQKPLNSVADAAEGSIDVWMAQLPNRLVHYACVAALHLSCVLPSRHRVWLWGWGAAYHERVLDMVQCSHVLYRSSSICMQCRVLHDTAWFTGAKGGRWGVEGGESMPGLRIHFRLKGR